MTQPDINTQNTVRIDGKQYEVDSLPDVAKISIEHLVAIDKEVQRLEMARAGFAQAIKAIMDGPDAPEPIAVPESTEPPVTTNAEAPPLKVVKTSDK
tara:strand:+ start:1186 stop:1476 length:291 start_codon:yes stop_codon:yes gene_type:complete